MSKKETRRAARQAFPQAKSTGGSRSSTTSRAKGAGGGRNRRSASQTVKPPTLKRAAIQGIIVAVLYFVFIQWLWKSGAAIGANLLISGLAFILFTGVAYLVDRFKYQRSLRKTKGTTK